MKFQGENLTFSVHLAKDTHTHSKYGLDYITMATDWLGLNKTRKEMLIGELLQMLVLSLDSATD